MTIMIFAGITILLALGVFGILEALIEMMARLTVFVIFGTLIISLLTMLGIL